MSETDLLFRWAGQVQSFCFYWKQYQRRGVCREMNGHYCVFCELSDSFDKDMEKAGLPTRSVVPELPKGEVFTK